MKTKKLNNAQEAIFGINTPHGGIINLIDYANRISLATLDLLASEYAADNADQIEQVCESVSDQLTTAYLTLQDACGKLYEARNELYPKKSIINQIKDIVKES
ncbi:MAG: hypothetical protein K6G40_08670 [Eubacterium sp.]|nr:hypothetical protein [Eubacterium sp.]